MLLGVFKRLTGISAIQDRINDSIRLAKVGIYSLLLTEYGLGKSEADKHIAARVTDSLFFSNQKDFLILATEEENPFFSEEEKKESQQILKYRNKLLKDSDTRDMVVEILKMYLAYHMYLEIKDQKDPSNEGINIYEWQEVIISRFLKRYDPNPNEEPNILKAMTLAHEYWEKYGKGTK